MNIDMRSKKPLHDIYYVTGKPQRLRVPTDKDIAEMSAKELKEYLTEYELSYINTLPRVQLRFLFGGENSDKKTSLDYKKQAVMNHIKGDADLEWASSRKAEVDDATELYKALKRKREDPEPEAPEPKAPEPKAEPDAGRAAETPKPRKKIVKTRA